ncbi:MAG TPA: hypothetical protein VF121_12265 [Thermoanaerobaculia bacterium]|nr:hypothetical protein [Thermoanaerobaculia bacterium]
MADYEDWLEKWIAEDGDRVRSLLGKVVATCGMTRKDLDQRLRLGVGYTSAVLTGRIELKQEHVSAILLGVGVHPGLFFGILYPTDRPIGPVAATPDIARRLALADLSGQGAEPVPVAAAPPMTAAEIKALVDESIQRALAATKHQRLAGGRKKSRMKRKS